jgi:nucleoside-diphosphate-sugar epimerase
VAHVLVTGGASFIGRNVVDRLLDEGHQVIATIRNRPIEHHGDLHVHKVDLACWPDVCRLGKPDAIVHCAAALPIDANDWNDFARDNIEATKNLARFAREREIEHLINCSTMSVYGDIETKMVDHLTPCRNPSPYGQSKLESEDIAEAAARSVISLRLPGVVGKGAHHIFLAQVLQKLSSGEPIRLYASDGLFNNLVHVDDLADFIAHLVYTGWNGKHRLPLASDEPITVGAAIDILANTLGTTAVVEPAEKHASSFIIDDKAARLLGYRPRTVTQAITDYARA